MTSVQAVTWTITINTNSNTNTNTTAVCINQCPSQNHVILTRVAHLRKTNVKRQILGNDNI